MDVRVLIVIPAYNEEQSILGVVESVRAAGYDYVVIDDGSTDATAHVCATHGIHCVRLPQNLGIGGAVQTGHIYAWEHGYDADVQMDGDGQHDVAYVPRLVEALQAGADLVIGSRFLEPSEGFQSTRLRRLGIGWLRGCIRRHTGLLVTDATSGFRATGRRALELFSRRYPADYPEPESIVFAHNRGLRVCEVPVVMHERQGGTSSISPLKSIYYMVKVTSAIAIEGSMHGRGR